MHNYIVKIKNPLTNECRIVITPKLLTASEARNFVKTQTRFDKYEDAITEICAIIDFRQEEGI